MGRGSVATMMIVAVLQHRKFFRSRYQSRLSSREQPFPNKHPRTSLLRDASSPTLQFFMQSHDMIPGVNPFFDWIGLKQKLHQGTQSPPLVTAGDIWWASVGQNVGSEINGRSR
jgi:hypothetical protein